MASGDPFSSENLPIKLKSKIGIKIRYLRKRQGYFATKTSQVLFLAYNFENYYTLFGQLKLILQLLFFSVDKFLSLYQLYSNYWQSTYMVHSRKCENFSGQTFISKQLETPHILQNRILLFQCSHCSAKTTLKTPPPLVALRCDSVSGPRHSHFHLLHVLRMLIYKLILIISWVSVMFWARLTKNFNRNLLLSIRLSVQQKLPITLMDFLSLLSQRNITCLSPY